MNQIAVARQALACLDFTSLPDEWVGESADELPEGESPPELETLCRRALTPAGPVAAVCVPGPWVSRARELLAARGAERIRVASVANFPHGSDDPETVGAQIAELIRSGAQEIDVVLPYGALLRGDVAHVEAVLANARDATDDRVLKVILETGELPAPEMIARASEFALAARADFLKTSTGKVRINATPEAARIMLTAIVEHGNRCGFKASGGIRTLDDAATYIALTTDILGMPNVTPDRFRIGASGVLDALLSVLPTPCDP